MALDPLYAQTLTIFSASQLEISVPSHENFACVIPDWCSRKISCETIINGSSTPPLRVRSSSEMDVVALDSDPASDLAIDAASDAARSRRAFVTAKRSRAGKQTRRKTMSTRFGISRNAHVHRLRKINSYLSARSVMTERRPASVTRRSLCRLCGSPPVAQPSMQLAASSHQ